MPKYVIGCRKRDGNGGYTKLTRKDCDFVVAYVYERGWIFIVPVRALRSQTFGVYLRKDGSAAGTYTKYLDAWHLLE